MTEEGFLRFLQERGLTAVDGARTVEQLGQQYGVRRWYDFIDAIYLPPSPLFPENRERYFVRCHTPTTLVPPAEFCCDFDFTGKALANHHLALERFSALFGTPEIGAAVNTWSHNWVFDGASLELTTFIREKTRSYNPLYQRHPGLWEKCSVRVQIDPVTPLMADEYNYLMSLALTDRLEFSQPHRADRSLATHPFRYGGSGLFPAWLKGRLSTNHLVCWRDGFRQKLGWYLPGSAVFWESNRCTGLKLVRLSPARGGGSATIYLVMRNPFSRANEEVLETVLYDEEWNGLNLAAQRLQEFWALTLQAEEYPDE
jgi:hypothetical protein